MSQTGPCGAGSAAVGTEELVEVGWGGSSLGFLTGSGRGTPIAVPLYLSCWRPPTMSIFMCFIGLHPRTNRVIGTVNGKTPGSVWHCAQVSSPSSTQLTHLPNGVGCLVRKARRPGQAPAEDAKPLPPPQVRSEPGTWEDQNCYGYGGGGGST